MEAFHGWLIAIAALVSGIVIGWRARRPPPPAPEQREATPAERKLMGVETLGDRAVTVTVRDWDAMKRAVWRSAKAIEIIADSAAEIIDRCGHVDGCPGIESETEPCTADRYEPIEGSKAELVSAGCPDRETRMSALVILNAARQVASTDARRPADGPYFAPSREYFSEVLSSLAAAQIEIEELRKEARRTADGPRPPASLLHVEITAT